jgi:hypothetical protein
MITETTRIERSDRAVHRELADGTGVLLHVETGAYFRLNRTGVMVWDLLEQGMSLQELIDRLRRRIPDAYPQLIVDIPEFLGSLVERNLISVEDGTGD